MPSRSTGSVIQLRGVRQNNLKNFDLDLPANQLLVVTGLSGSGKSSLAFDTLYAEGQRRYIETFSPYARQFFDRMDKPQVDSIQGIPPAIAIEQRNSVKSTRSTVGTMTEICEYMKVVWSKIAQLYCRQCQSPVRKDAPGHIWERIREGTPPSETPEVLVTFQIALSDKLSLEDSLALIAKQGYQRLLVTADPASLEIVRMDDAVARCSSARPDHLTVVQDRVKLLPANRARFIEACEQAYHFGQAQLVVYFPETGRCLRFSNRLHCATCDLEYRAPSAALFSFNHPVGACPTCRGFGRTITIDYALAIPDPSRSIAEGVVKPWQSGQSAECQQDLLRSCRKHHIPIDVPFSRLSPEWQRWVIDGEPDYGKDAEHEWPRAWYGVKGYFRWLESKAYKMHVRVLLSRYRAYRTCPACGGRRFQPDALLFQCASPEGKRFTLADFYQLSVNEALAFVNEWMEQHPAQGRSDPLHLVLREVGSRLGYLQEVGLGYLTLDRPTRSLSGGETERVNLTTCLGSGLVNTLFVLDEPSVGLHARDTARLIGILERLRDAGNTVLVVEHEPSMMRAADQIIDLGPGHGEAGGALVFQGSYRDILKSKESLTGAYLRGSKRADLPRGRPAGRLDQASRKKGSPAHLRFGPVRRNNLKDLTVLIPLERFVCISGVSGSGKTTLVREALFPLLQAKLSGAGLHPIEADDSSELDEEAANDAASDAGTVATLEGWEAIGRVVLVDQSSLGKTPRSNPAVYIGAFDHLRDLFARSEEARSRGLNASAFSFNSAQGQCEQCRGVGFEKIEMQFLSDVYIRCPGCQGRRYRQHILDVKLSPPTAPNSALRTTSAQSQPRHWSIADLLEATVDDCLEFLGGFPESRVASKAAEQLRLLQDVGLGYLRVGQPINTLSGGESQRLKLVRHLAEFAAAQGLKQKPTLFLFDEPTTGLHFHDVKVLLEVFQRLVDQGHSVVVIEHNLDLMKSADWIIDLGPEAGEEGGHLVVEGTPEQVAACAASHTGRSLREAGVKPSAPPMPRR